VAAPSPSLFGWENDHDVREKTDTPGRRELYQVRPGREVSDDRAARGAHSGADQWAEERHGDRTDMHADATERDQSQR
jgi:hypothetical protein